MANKRYPRIPTDGSSEDEADASEFDGQELFNIELAGRIEDHLSRNQRAQKSGADHAGQRGRLAKNAGPARPAARRLTKLRIIGGTMRSRLIKLEIDPQTRPMKDRTREAIFNLVGGSLDGYFAFDLFAGSGILAIESISRGAHGAVAIEYLAPVAAEIRKNAAALNLSNLVTIVGNVIRQPRMLDNLMNEHRQSPWVVFVCPPYRLWHESTEDMRELLLHWYERAPSKSFIVVELDEKITTDILPPMADWDIRRYAPARVAVCEKG